MSWTIDLGTRTATANGVIIKFRELPANAHLDRSCFVDREDVTWRGAFTAASSYLSDEAQRMRTLFEGVDEYRRVACRAPDPFPDEHG